MKRQKIDDHYYVTVVPSVHHKGYDARIHSYGIGIVASENGYPTEAEAMRAGVREGHHIAGFGTVNGRSPNRAHVRQHPRRTATGGRTTVGAYTRNRAARGVSSDFHQRLRNILDSGYNSHATRPLSTQGSLTSLRKRIATRMDMANKGVRLASARPAAYEALQIAYRFVEDEELRQHGQKSLARERSNGSKIVRLSDGREMRFDEIRPIVQEWAVTELKGMPVGSTAKFYHTNPGSSYSRTPYMVWEKNEYGNVVSGRI